MKIKHLVFLIGLTTMVLPVMAQETRVLQENEITESTLIETFAPERSIRTRSIKVFGDPSDFESEQVQEPPQPASAAMLITFHTNSAELTPGARKALNAVGRALNMDKLADFKFTIEGHTDPRGSYELNQRLSQARAETVLNYLVREHGVERSRLVAIGKGYNELLNRSNPTAPENRRVQMNVIK